MSSLASATMLRTLAGHDCSICKAYERDAAPCSNRGAPHGCVPHIVAQRCCGHPCLRPDVSCAAQIVLLRQLLRNQVQLRNLRRPRRDPFTRRQPHRLAAYSSTPGRPRRSAGRPARAAQPAACGWGHDSFPAVPAHTQPTGRRRRSTPAWARGRAALISPPYSSAQSADHARHAEKRRAAQGVRARRPGR